MDGSYPFRPLNPHHPRADGEALAAGLKKQILCSSKDLDQQGMEEALFQFGEHLNKETLALFFFAGHGIQAQGTNYLIPIKAEFRAEYELKHKAFSANMVLEALESAGVPLKVLVLDCCRDNPLARSWKTRSTSTRGLATMAETQGTIIAYSTGPGEVADDGKGKNSPYTEALTTVLKSRPKEGLELYEVFRTASRQVKTRTGQIPWVNADATIPDYYLVKGDGSVPVPAEMTGQIVDGLPAHRLNEMQEQLGELKQMLEEKNTQNPEAAATPPAGNEQIMAMFQAVMEQNRAMLEQNKALQEELARRAGTPGSGMANSAPSAPATRSGLPYDEEALKRFIVSFDKSGELDDASATAQFYADRVDNFFDKYGLTRAEIRDGRADYIQKFPYRSYEAERYEILGSTASTVTVSYVSRYALQSNTGRTLSGTAHTTMKLRILSPTAFEIYSINQSVNKD